MSASEKAERDGSADWRTYVRLLGYARPYTGRLVVGFFFGLIFAGSSLGILPVLRENFSHLIDYENVSLRQALLTAALLPLFALVRGIGSYASAYLIQWVGNRVVMDLREGMFARVHALSLEYFDQGRTGEVISRTVNDTMLVERAVSTVLMDVARHPVLLVGAIGYAVYLDWRLAIGGLLLFPMFMLPVGVLGRKVRRASREGQERLGDVMSIMQESVAGVRVVKAFGTEAHESKRFDAQCHRFFRLAMRVAKAKAILDPIVVVVSALGLFVAFGFAAARHIPFPDFLTFAISLVMVYEPAKKLSRLHLSVQQSSGAADRIFELIDTPVTVEEAPDAVDLQGPMESVTFDDVHFAYDDKPVLRGISFSARAGERIAIVGGSGAGKTTLVNLVPRFFDVTEGAVRVNAQDVRELRMTSLRSEIGVVTQETFLFNETVANNIAYGRPETTREEVERAAQRAHAHAFIQEMPDGYDTVIGERGVRLSGGQRQRLSIARAILRNPPILILDEATSALDTESERLVQDALTGLMEGRTVFAIAHRLSTIASCDRILVLDQGRIAESGSHAELLAADGIYKRLYDLQFQV